MPSQATPGYSAHTLAADRNLDKRQIHNFVGVLRRLLSSGLNQTKVAKLLGVEQPTISGILHGKQGVSVGTAIRLAEVADIALEEIMGVTTSQPLSFSLEAACKFARANGISEDVISDYCALETGNGMPAEDIYFEIRTLAKSRSRTRLNSDISSAERLLPDLIDKD